MRRMRAAVIGAGHLGRYHAQKYAALDGVELAAVVDVDPDRAQQLAAATGARAFDDHRAIAERVDVASVAVPTASHYGVACDLLDAGIHVLVEKPLTGSVDEGRELIERSARCGRVLQVGHVERFNPVVQALLRHVEAPLFIECHRIAPFRPRGTDVDVVLDLMIHDIDLVLQLVDAPLLRIDASGGLVLSGQVDIANARLQFANGCVANLTASRVAGKSERSLRLFQRDAYFSADLARHCLTIHRKGDTDGEPLCAERLDFDRCDALAAEIDAFVRSVRDGEPPAVSGSDGLRALQTAVEIMRRIEAQPRPT